MKPKSEYSRRILLDRLLDTSILKQLGLLVVALFVLYVFSILALLIFCWQDACLFCSEENLSRGLLPLYLLLDPNLLNNIYLPHSGHIFGTGFIIVSTVIYVLGVVVFGGMLISMLVNGVNRRIERHRDGDISYLKSGHYVIMGYDEMVHSIILSIMDRDPKARILILSSVPARVVMEKIGSSVARGYKERIFPYYGHRTIKDSYGKIHLESAEEVYIVGNRTLPAHDAINIECVDSIYNYLKPFKDYPRTITCVFEDLDTYGAFKTTEVFRHLAGMGIDFVPINFYTLWARKVFIDRRYKSETREEPYTYPTVYREPITRDSEQYVHLVFVGITYLGVAFANEAANYFHFPPFRDGRTRKTVITFIDKVADEEMPLFVTRNRYFFSVQPPEYRDLSGNGRDHEVTIPEMVSRASSSIDGTLDVKFEFIKGDIFSREVQDELCRWAGDEKQDMSIFLTLANQKFNFAIGMNMPDDIYTRGIPIFIRQDRSDNFVTNLRENTGTFTYSTLLPDRNNVDSKQMKGRYANIYPIGMDSDSFLGGDDSLIQAKLINYLYSMKAAGKEDEIESVEALSLKDEGALKAFWDNVREMWRGTVREGVFQALPVSKKWSSQYSASSIPIRTASLHAMRGNQDDDSPLTEEEVAIFSEVEHNRWCVEELLLGYRPPRPEENKYNAQTPPSRNSLGRNEDLFIHSDLRPFKDLDEVKENDRFIVGMTFWIRDAASIIKSRGLE